MEFSNESLLGKITPHLDNFDIPFSDKSHSIITSLYIKIKAAIEMEKLYQKKRTRNRDDKRNIYKRFI